MEYEKLSYDVLRQQVPFMIYKQLSLEFYNKIYYFNPEIPVGYVYLLRTVSFKANYIPLEGGLPKSSYRIEFVRSLRGRVMQNVPTPLSLFSTPGWSDAQASESPPVPPSPTAIVFTDLPQKKNTIILNYLYQHRETIETKLTHYSPVPDPEQKKFFLNIMLFGYFLPEFTLDMWK